MPIIVDITKAGRVYWEPYRKDEDVQRVYEETLSAGYANIYDISRLEAALRTMSPGYKARLRLLSFQPNFQRREIQELWNLEVVELRLIYLWKLRREKREIWPGYKEEVEPGMDGRDARKDFTFIQCTIEAKELLMREAEFAHRSRVRIEEALAHHGRAQTAPARLTKGSKYEAKLDAINVKDEANRKANRKLSFEARARKLVEGGDARSLSTAKKWLSDLDSR